ncbi:general secretion pathway protein E [Neokomagataea thailandica NBRC 106555]|uniref:Type II secretion system protein GspE n=2 Tax=Neokomagataea TaxID=1223423 RepID=A0A4Y6V5I1_9PROT|nr:MULTISPECIES: ATPase, T2SS/T4P/T4SS family [Neokomagataea]QDH25319.1 type II secretion system protein GspE [Neokomagataea tanensis]GBR52506.1 general secretion pathway protein E [Neokomagataea thailandica NBRC 106555]
MNDAALFETSNDLGHWLVQSSVCDPRVVERGKAVAQESSQGLAAVMLQLGLVTEADLAETYAAMLGRPLVPANALEALEEPFCGELLSSRFMRQARVVPVYDDGVVLHLVMADPLDDFTADAISLAAGREVCREAGRLSDIDAALNRLYPEEDTEPADDEKSASDDLAEDDTDRLKDLASEAPVIRLVNQIIFRAVENKASDIHIEPDENRLVVRYRYDGVLHEAESLSPRMTAALTSRIKIMARLDIAERRLPQDGRIKLAVRGHEVDFRVSTVPGLHGEIVVLRVLDRTAVRFDYTKLGLSGTIIDAFKNALDMPNGIVLVTGPTGSGKTTTLYTGLSGLNATERNVMTVEDPIEYQLSGINQLQVKPAIGLNFSSLLRAILRQDPDVIMVGEIRDLETAQIAVQAALTGHLVLSTLHTNSAAAAVTRLRDMGLEDYLLTAVLRGVLAQRLVRRLCTSCRKPAPMMPELAERLGLETHSGHTLWQATGCPECRHTGHRGRLAIAEYLNPSKAVTRLILAGADHVEIEAAAMEEGMETMFRAGLMAALQGETTLEEVSRAVGSES